MQQKFSAGAHRPAWKFLDGHHDACKCAMETLQTYLHHGKDTEVCGLGSAPCWQHEDGCCLQERAAFAMLALSLGTYVKAMSRAPHMCICSDY